MKHCVIIFLIVIGIACQKQITPVYVNNASHNEAPNGIYLVNEGNFGFGNGSIGRYDENTKTYTHRIFESKNQIPLGDVPQSMYIDQDKVYIAVNSSGLLVSCKAKNFELINTHDNMGSPRFIEKVNDSLLLFSELYANAVHLYHTVNHETYQDLPIPSSTEWLLTYQNKIFICAPKRPYLYVFDKNSLNISDSIRVEKGIKGIVLDHDDKLWTLHSNNYEENITAQLFKINPILESIDTNIILEDSLSYSQLSISSSRKKLFFSHAGQVEYFDIPNMTKHSSTFKTDNLYGLNIHPISNEIYISNAKDYVQSSIIYRLDSNFNLIDSFEAGVNCSQIYFNP